MDRPSARRYHAACQLNQWMVIHGGLGYNDDVLIDMWLYYPSKQKSSKFGTNVNFNSLQCSFSFEIIARSPILSVFA